jgi:protein SCO1/2
MIGVGSSVQLISWFRGFLLLVSALVLVGCSDQASFKGSDITSGTIGQGWALTDHHGVAAPAERFEGKVTVVFFGFTQCPDICPAALSEVNLALTQLGDRARDVRVLMITIDPQRDTPDILASYLDIFSQGVPSEFLGLTGNDEQIRQAARAFRAYYAKVATPDGSYTMDHSTSFYLFDKSGAARVLVSHQAGADVLAHDIAMLLQ